MELFTAGLLTDVFNDAEALQKGNWGALGDLAAKFVGASPSTLYLALADDEGEHMAIEAEAHAVLAMNTPYLGANCRVADDIRYDDGCLDVFLYAGLNKLDLLAQGVAIATDGARTSASGACAPSGLRSGQIRQCRSWWTA